MERKYHRKKLKEKSRVIKNQDIGPAAETLVADYVNDNKFDITPYISKLQYRDSRKRIAELKARQAVEEILKMRYYKTLHEDYSD